MPIDKQKQHIIAALKALEAEVAKLAPHPNAPDFRGVSATGIPQDGLVGGLIVEQMAGMAFGGMIPAALEGIDVSNVVEAYDMFSVERARDRLGLKRAACLSFNGAAESSPFKALEKEFEKDLPKRVQLVRHHMSLTRTLEEMDAEPDFLPKFKPEFELKEHQKRMLASA